MVEHLIFTYNFNLEHIEKSLENVSDDQMAQQAHGVVNHPAWTLLHLASASNMTATTLGLDSTFPSEWEDVAKNGPGQASSAFPTKTQLLAELSSQHSRVAEAVTKADVSLFAKEFPNENYRKTFPTIGDFCAYLLTAHEGSHIGQIAAWKRAMKIESHD